MGCIYVQDWLKPIFSLYLTCLPYLLTP